MSKVVTDDAFDALPQLPAESVHAVVTDPPYGLAFMGRDWDDFEPKEYRAWCEEWAALALEVLKPGGHLLAFSGNRTHHRLFSGVEDAGFEVRDTLTWHYGSGFPKALDVSKAIDKAAGAEREKYPNPLANQQTGQNDTDAFGDKAAHTHISPKPATDAAREWDGWKTALKPAAEFIVLARKPFSGTVAENVQAHGTGALNIGATRIDADDDPSGSGTGFSEGLYEGGHNQDGYEAPEDGRYPANVILDYAAAEAMDYKVGELPSGELKGQYRGSTGDDPVYGEYGVDAKDYPADTGGPSRFFYVHGWDQFAVEWNTRLFYTSKATRAERTLDGKIENAHPTVKPIDLMEWLVRLITKEGQTVLDPFAGTGTTGRAAKNLGRQFVGIERDPKWADVARARLGMGVDDPTHVRTDPHQTGVADF